MWLAAHRAPANLPPPPPAAAAARCPQATYFYAGRSFTEEEWRRVKATGELPALPQEEPGSSSPSEEGPLGFGELLAFSGPAPELINGR